MALPFRGDAVKLVVPQYGKLSWSCVWSQRDEAGVVTAVPLANYTAKSQARSRVGGELLADFTDYVQIEPGGVTGKVLLSVPGSVTAGVNRDGVWDLFLVPISGGGSPIKLIDGRVVADRAVTQGVIA